MAANPPTRHHFVPEFYQRRWAGEDGQIERYELFMGNVLRRRVPPKAAGFRENLYRAPHQGLDDWQAQILEWKIFQTIDNAASLALQAFISNDEAVRVDRFRHDWTVFLRSMLLRTPFQMASTLHALEKIWSDVDVEEKYGELRTQSMPDTAAEFLKALNPNVAKESAFNLFMGLVGSDRLTHQIAGMPWRIIDCSASNYRLLLSDHPVVLVPLDTKNGQIAMPLSPNKILVASRQSEVRRQIDHLPAKHAVKSLNKLTVTRAQHQVIACDRTQDAFIKKHFGKAPTDPFLAPSKLPSLNPF